MTCEFPLKCLFLFHGSIDIGLYDFIDVSGQKARTARAKSTEIRTKPADSSRELIRILPVIWNRFGVQVKTGKPPCLAVRR